MHSDKKISKEDTWRPSDLRRHIRERDHSDDYARRRDENERRHRGGESIERRHRDPEESRHRDKRDRERTRERADEDKYVDRRKDGSQTRRPENDREKRYERDREKMKLTENREDRDRKRDREEKRNRERDKERQRDREKERLRDGGRHDEEDRDKRREERDRERRREEREREHRGERRRHEESGERRRDHREKRHGEQSDQQHRHYYEDKRRDKDTQDRHRDRKHSEQREERDYKEEDRRPKEERELRHKERRHHDEKRKHRSETREHQDLKESAEGIRRFRGDSDRAERDKHREKQKKEEEDAEIRYREKRSKEKEDAERSHGDRTSSKKLPPEESHRHEKKEAVTKGDGMDPEQWRGDRKHRGDAEELCSFLSVVNDENLAEQEYEDDFEDYEDDFEEMDENAEEREDEEPLSPEVEDEEAKDLTAQQKKEVEAIQRAMAEENERAGTAQSRQSTSREEEDMPKRSKGSEQNKSASSQRGKFIDFVAAKRREVSQKVASKQKKRSAELLRLIDLDFSMTFCLLDLPPVSEYDMYIRNFGKANTKQAYVQCNEDNADRDIQTEEIKMSEKWTQHPPEHQGACGDPNLSQGARDESRSNMNIDSQRLTSFLRSASQVMVVLLEEGQAERQSLRKLKTQTDSLSFSDGSLQLNTKLPFLHGRPISLVHFSQVQRHTMMSVHMPTAEPSAVRLDSSTIICIWNIWEPSRPQKILLYESEVQCCCFSPRKATLVFAGTSVGSVVLWDLREHAGNHYCLKIREEEWTLRQPTFSTDAVMAASAHFSPVTSVEVVPSSAAGGLRAEVPLLASEEESSGLSFQLASLDESGVLNFWVVVELPKANEAGSPTDLGLRPGGKVKLLHSSSLLTAERSSGRGVGKTWPTQALLLKLHPTDSNHFFIGTSLGLVSHGTSHGVRAPPKFYRFQEGDVRPVNVSSIHFSPFKPHLFLVGCGDGSIRLHTISREQPVAEWRSSTSGSPVVSLQWAQTRPTVFCVLDAASNLHIWDLLKDDAQPVVTERMSADRVTAMAVFGDSGQHGTYSGVALAHESGKIELQYFSKSLTASSCAEEEKLERLITEAF